MLQAQGRTRTPCSLGSALLTGSCLFAGSHWAASTAHLPLPWLAGKLSEHQYSFCLFVCLLSQLESLVPFVVSLIPVTETQGSRSSPAAT